MLNLGSKKSASFDLSDLPRLIQAEEPAAAAAEMEALRKIDKSWMKQEPQSCTYDTFRLQKDQRRYTITHQDVPFECLYMPADNKRLYVMLSGGGTTTSRRYPLLLRWKYKNMLNGNILCIDDPMYYFHPEFTPVMWYYGTNEKSYLRLLLDIVKKVMSQLQIEAEDVTFIGSSGGGYSSLYCANLLDHSSAIAMNPQVVLKDWQSPLVYDHFKSIGIDLAAEDKFGRNLLQLTNKKSHFFILMNVGSPKEYKLQFTPFFENHNITPKFGVAQNGNIITWLHSTDYTQPHSAIFEKTGVAIADCILMQARDGADANDLNAISLYANEVMYEKYAIKTNLESTQAEMNTIYKYFVKNISRTIEEALYRRVPMQASPALRRFLDYNFKVETKAWKPGNIGYYIGEQTGFRYNIFYHGGKVYFRMKFDEFAKHISRKDEAEAVLNASRGEKLTRWYYEGDTIVMTLALDPDTAETQILELIDMSLAFLSEYLV